MQGNVASRFLKNVGEPDSSKRTGSIASRYQEHATAKPLFTASKSVAVGKSAVGKLAISSSTPVISKPIAGKPLNNKPVASKPIVNKFTPALAKTVEKPLVSRKSLKSNAFLKNDTATESTTTTAKPFTSPGKLKPAGSNKIKALTEKLVESNFSPPDKSSIGPKKVKPTKTSSVKSSVTSRYTPTTTSTTKSTWKKPNNVLGASNASVKRATNRWGAKKPARKISVKTTGKSFVATHQDSDDDDEDRAHDNISSPSYEAILKSLQIGQAVPSICANSIKSTMGTTEFVTALINTSLVGVDEIDLSCQHDNDENTDNVNRLSSSLQLQLIKHVLSSSCLSSVVLHGNEQLTNEQLQELLQPIETNKSIVNVEVETESEDEDEILRQISLHLERNQEISTHLDTLRQANVLPVARPITPRDNEITTMLLKVINNDPSVKSIHINNDENMKHVNKSLLLDFAESLPYNFYLQKLTLQQCNLGNTFLSTLATGITSNLYLQQIDLKHNTFTDESLLDFYSALADNKSLTEVDVSKQLSGIKSEDESKVLEYLTRNKTLQKLKLDVSSKNFKTELEAILQRNSATPANLDVDGLLIAHLEREAGLAAKLLSERSDTGPTITSHDNGDWKYLHRLAHDSEKYKYLDNQYDDEDNADGKATEEVSFESRLNLQSLTADGSFLTHEYISKYLVDNTEVGCLIFEYTNQFKMFKRFPLGDNARKTIVRLFVEVLVTHPRANEITHLHMANINCADDFLEGLCSKSLTDQCLPELHLINLETNCIADTGVVALADCLKDHKVWPYLQTVKLENQTMLMKTRAEAALAEAMKSNNSVIRFGIRVRNLYERDRIGRCVQRNMDIVRQARQHYEEETGTKKIRPRNKMEQFFDKIANNDPDITEVNLVSDHLFLGLSDKEVEKAGRSFADNTHITSVKMCQLRLGDAFGKAIADALRRNSTIESLLLDSNMMTGEGIKAIASALSENNTVAEVQLRHQGKKMAAVDEEEVGDLLGDNSTLVKMGVDFRSHSAKSKVEKKINRNMSNRKKVCTPSKPVPTNDIIKSVEVQKMFDKIIKNDPDVTSIVLNENKEYMEMDKIAKDSVFQAMKTNTHVKKLVMNDMQLDNEFADTMANILQSNTTLKEIELNGNLFTSPGILAICKAALSCKSMRRLSVKKPRFVMINDHVEELLTAMEKKKKIKMKKLNIDLREDGYAERLDALLQKQV